MPDGVAFQQTRLGLRPVSERQPIPPKWIGSERRFASCYHPLSASWVHHIRNPPDTSSFATSVVPLTGFGNSKSLLPRAKSDRDLPLKRSTAEARPIYLLEGVPLP